LLREVRRSVSDHSNQWDAAALDEGGEGFYFGRVATFGDAQYDIIALDQTKVPVNGVSGVHENGRSSRGIERCHQFLGDDGAFANPGHDDPPGAVQDELPNGLEGTIELPHQLCDGLALEFKGSGCPFYPIHNMPKIKPWIFASRSWNRRRASDKTPYL